MPAVHRELRLLPFRGSSAIERGLITRGALRGKAWRRLMSDVYIEAVIEMDYRLWCYAVAQYVSPRGAIAGMSAAYLHGVDLRPSPGAPSLGVLTPDALSPKMLPSEVADLGLPIEAVVPTAVRKAGAPQVKLVRSPLPPSHVSITSGVRATTPARTAFDLGRQLPLIEAVRAIDVLCFRCWRPVGRSCGSPRPTFTANQTKSAPRFAPRSRSDRAIVDDWKFMAHFLAIMRRQSTAICH